MNITCLALALLGSLYSASRAYGADIVRYSSANYCSGIYYPTAAQHVTNTTYYDDLMTFGYPIWSDLSGGYCNINCANWQTLNWYSFKFVVEWGYAIDVASFAFSSMSWSGGPSQYHVYFRAENLTNTITLAPLWSPLPGYGTATYSNIVLSAAGLGATGLVGEVQLLVWGKGASGSSTTWPQHDIALSGTLYQLPGTPPPLRPPSVTASDGLFVDHISVSWAQGSGASGYEVWRATTNSPAVALRIVTLGNITNYDDYGASASVTNYYWIKSTNSGGSSSFSIYDAGLYTPLAPTNSTPTNILLSGKYVSENLPVSTTVGSFSTQDPDATNTFNYSLVAGTGSEDNSSFTISGSNLLTAAVFNYEVKSNYSIRVQSVDQGNLSTQKIFALNITDITEPPPTFSEAPTLAGSNMVMRWGSITNKKYTIHYSTNLISGFSILQSNIPGTPAINSYTDTLTIVTQKYWKITTDP